VHSGGGFGNHERQFYTNRNDNSVVGNGTLKIKAFREQYGGESYTSAKLQSRAEFLYGKVSIRARLSRGQAMGTWAALWMMPRSLEYGQWPKSGEIDIMEHVGYNAGKIHGTVHAGCCYHSMGTQVGGSTHADVAEWHTYQMEWSPEIIKFALDGNVYQTYSKTSDDPLQWPFNKPFYIIVNLAVGGDWGGLKGIDEGAFGGDGQIMEIDWVSVEQKDWPVPPLATGLSMAEVHSNTSLESLNPGGGDSIKVMSYNLMGWNAFNQNRWRGDNVMQKVKSWHPAVLGCQEVETGGGQGYDEVRGAMESGTGLTHAGGAQFYDPAVVEPHETEQTSLMGGYWMSMTRFKMKKTNEYFLLFNSHWKHGYGIEQATKVASFIQSKREQFGPLPVVLMGDTNQFCNAHDSPAWKYLKGEEGDSPVVLEDAIDDLGKSFSDYNNPDCRVDLIMVSQGDWSVHQSFIDRDGMGLDGDASDHAPLHAELTLKDERERRMADDFASHSYMIRGHFWLAFSALLGNSYILCYSTLK
jgi:beta-glucanase (GH16 family)